MAPHGSPLALLLLLWLPHAAPTPTPSPCEPPRDAFLAPTYHLLMRNGSRLVHEADSAATLHVDGLWHWFIGCDSGWHHITSRDLVDWEFARPLVVEGQGGDTGSIAVTPAGVYIMVPGCGGICRRVALDRTLESWGPVAPAINSSHPKNFRDPARPWLAEDGSWYMVVGSGQRLRERGPGQPGAQAWLYRAADATLYDAAAFSI